MMHGISKHSYCILDSWTFHFISESSTFKAFDGSKYVTSSPDNESHFNSNEQYGSSVGIFLTKKVVFCSLNFIITVRYGIKTLTGHCQKYVTPHIQTGLHSDTASVCYYFRYC